MTFIRKANEQDMGTLIQLYQEFHYFHVQGVPDRLRWPESSDAKGQVELVQALRAIMLRDDAVILVALSGERIIGLAEVYVRQDEEHPLTIAYCYGHIQSLFITASFRRQGVGKLLLASAQQWAKRKGATEMHVDTWEFEAGPLPFYESMGYRTLKRRMVGDI